MSARAKFDEVDAEGPKKNAAYPSIGKEKFLAEIYLENAKNRVENLRKSKIKPSTASEDSSSQTSGLSGKDHERAGGECAPIPKRSKSKKGTDGQSSVRFRLRGRTNSQDTSYEVGQDRLQASINKETLENKEREGSPETTRRMRCRTSLIVKVRKRPVFGNELAVLCSGPPNIAKDISTGAKKGKKALGKEASS